MARHGDVVKQCLGYVERGESGNGSVEGEPCEDVSSPVLMHKHTHANTDSTTQSKLSHTKNNKYSGGGKRNETKTTLKFSHVPQSPCVQRRPSPQLPDPPKNCDSCLLT